MKKTLLLLSLIIYSVALTQAQSPDIPKLDRLFDLIEEHGKGMGSVSIFHNGQEVYARSYGYRDVENAVKADAGTRYRVGSVSKTFTGAVIMKLVEEGKLSLSSLLLEYYPEIPNAGSITVEQLLRHRSGIFNFTNAPDYSSWCTAPQTKEELLRRIVAGGTVFEPDERQEYSNSNYVLLTFIAEDVTGKTFPELLDGMIFTPLKLSDTRAGGAIDPTANEAYSYRKLASDWVKDSDTDMSVPLGAGYIVSTPRDVSVFLTNLFGGNIVSPASLQKMMEMQDGYGLGMFSVPFYDLRAYGHTGGIDGFQSQAFLLPEHGYSVVILSNGAVYPLNQILINALSASLGYEWQLPEFADAIYLTVAEQEKYTGVYYSPLLPISITVAASPSGLTAQGTGQPSFPLECFGEGKFRFETAGIVMEFYPEENKAILIQAGVSFPMTREQPR